MLFALMTEGVNPLQREEMWDAVCEPLNAAETRRAAEAWRKGTFGG